MKEKSAFRSVWIASYVFVLASILAMNNGIGSIQTIGFFFVLAVGAMLPVEQLLMFIVMMEPLGAIYRINGRYTVMPFLFIILFVKLVAGNKTISKKKLIPMFGLMAISIYNYVTRGYNISTYVGFFIALLCFVWASGNKCINMQRVFEKSIWLFVLSVLIESIASRTMPTVVRMVREVSAYEYRLAGFTSSWNYGRHVVVAIAFLVYWLRYQNGNKLIAGALIGYFLECMISTGLYSGLLAIGLMLLLIPFSFQGTIKQRITYVSISLLVCAVVFLIIYNYVYLPMYNLRGQISDNGRFDIWKMYYDIFVNDAGIFFGGIGAGAIQDYAASKSILTTHSIVIEKLFELGIVGTGLLIFLISGCTRKQNQRISTNGRLLPLATFLGTCLTQGVSGNELIFILMIICI